MPARVVFCVSAHGYGHATRSGAVIAALAAAPNPPHVHVRSEAPAWLFTARAAGIECSRAPVDVGLLQPNGLDVDLAATRAAHEAFVAGWDAAVAREAAFLRGHGATLVVGDVPPLAFAAARRAGIPAVAMANFGWDWVLEGFAADDARWRPIAARYREAYGEAAVLYRLPLHGDLSAFREIVDVPFVVNRSRRTRDAARAALGIAAGDPRRVVLVSFGGFGGVALEDAAGEDLSAYRFVGIGPRPTGLTADWIALPRPSKTPHEDLVRAADAVLGKAGYSTVAEALAHGARYLHIERTGFREIPVLVEGLARYGCARALSRADFVAGRWRAALDALFAQPAPAAAPPTNGAEQVAAALSTR